MEAGSGLCTVKQQICWVDRNDVGNNTHIQKHTMFKYRGLYQRLMERLVSAFEPPFIWTTSYMVPDICGFIPLCLPWLQQDMTEPRTGEAVHVCFHCFTFVSYIYIYHATRSQTFISPIVRQRIASVLSIFRQLASRWGVWLSTLSCCQMSQGMLWIWPRRDGRNYGNDDGIHRAALKMCWQSDDQTWSDHKSTSCYHHHLVSDDIFYLVYIFIRLNVLSVWYDRKAQEEIWDPGGPANSTPPSSQETILEMADYPEL